MLFDWICFAVPEYSGSDILRIETGVNCDCGETTDTHAGAFACPNNNVIGKLRKFCWAENYFLLYISKTKRLKDSHSGPTKKKSTASLSDHR